MTAPLPRNSGVRPRLAVVEQHPAEERRRPRADRYGLRPPRAAHAGAARVAPGARRRPLARIVNTHCHSDHMGGNAAVARAYGCPIAVPEGEAPLIERWDTKALWIDYAGQTAERFNVDDVIVPGATYVWGDLEWRALAAPGHDMGAVVFHNAEHRILISGDALWENGYGLVMPPRVDPAALPATRATLDMLAEARRRGRDSRPWRAVHRRRCRARARIRTHGRVRGGRDAYGRATRSRCC